MMEVAMKNILLLVHDDAGQEARLQAALDLTRALDGHLSCLDVTPTPVIVGDCYGGVGTAVLIADARESEGRNKAALQARLAHEDVPWDWSDVTGDFADAVAAAAMLADVIVLNRRLEEDCFPNMRDVAARVLTQTRSPVLAVPEGLGALSVKRALVAWDGQPSSATTLRACVPLLQLAQAVHILTVRDGAERAEPAEAAAYLSRHGIHASVRIIQDGLHAADQHITAESEAFHADYVLMGAYTHGRLIETFGGVTKRMLGSAKLPLLLGH